MLVNKKGNPKFFIDYENKIRECGDCRKTKPFSDFYMTVNLTPKTDCKICYKSAVLAREETKLGGFMIRNMNELARKLTKLEAGKRQVDIAQMKEVLARISDLLATDENFNIIVLLYRNGLRRNIQFAKDSK